MVAFRIDKALRTKDVPLCLETYTSNTKQILHFATVHLQDLCVFISYLKGVLTDDSVNANPVNSYEIYRLTCAIVIQLLRSPLWTFKCLQ